jgi:hypothetical protein
MTNIPPQNISLPKITSTTTKNQQIVRNKEKKSALTPYHKIYKGIIAL